MNFHHRLLRILTVTFYGLIVFSLGMALLPLTDVAAAGGSGRLISAGSPSNGPLAIPARVTIASVSAGNLFACGVKNDSTLVCWGDSSDGKLNAPTSGTFIQVSASMAGAHACAVNTDGSVACWGKNNSGQATPPTGDTFIQVSAGYNFTCGVKTDGKLRCWGFDDPVFHQATPPSGTFTQVSAGLNHACAIKSDGTLACWGYDDPYFHLGTSWPNGTFTQISAGSNFNCALKSNNTLLCWGNDANGQTNSPTGAFTQVSAGITHACALSSAGTLACWGDHANYWSTAPTDTFTQVSAGSGGTLGVKTNGTLSQWGSSTFTLPDGRFTRRFVSSGYSHSCTLRTDATLNCWGDDTYLQSSPPPDTFLQVSAGDSHTCALQSDGTLACWGYNGNGQTDAPDGLFTQVTVGESHSCALKVDGTISCWGGDDYHNQSVGIPSGVFVQISAGNYHTCALRDDGTLACWGFSADNDSITPPTGTFTQVSAGGWHTCAIANNGSVACWGWHPDRDNGQLNPPGGIFTQISTGYDFACGIRPGGAVECWGGNDYGQGNVPSNTSFVQISAGAEHVCGVEVNGALMCWGKNDDGQAPQLDIYPPTLQDGVKGTPYSQTLTGLNGPPLSPYTFAIIGSGQQDGLTFNPVNPADPSTAIISGTPLNLGNFTFTIQMTDANNFIIQKTYSLTVGLRVKPNMSVELHNSSHTVLVTAQPVGTSVHDKATVAGVGSTGKPTGTVVFTVYANTECSGTVTSTNTIALPAGSTSVENSPLLLTGAGLAFTTYYSGDSNYIAVTGPCQVLQPIRLFPTIITHIHDPLDNVVTEAPAGMPAHDTVSVTGSFVPPTGKINYSMFYNPNCTGEALPIGPPDNSLYNGSALASEEEAQTNAGISFMAHYSGDLNYSPGDSACEPLAFGKLTPLLATNLHNAAHEVVTVLPIASMVHDNALVTGSFGTATGDVTFTLYNHKQNCTGASSTQTLSLNNGTVESTALRTPNTGLSYTVSYAGDVNYKAVTATCQALDFTKLDPLVDFVFHDADHNVITTATPGSWVHVSAAFSGDADIPTGTVTYSAYNNLTCTGDPADLQPVDLADDGSGSGVAHSTTEMQVLASGLSYKIYYPGDANYKVVNSACLPLKMDTITTLTSSKNPSIVGKLVTFTITVTCVAGPVTGQVTLNLDGVPVQIALNSSGVGSYTTGMLTYGPPNPHVLTARFAGDIAHNPSTSPELDQNIIKENLYSPIVIGN